MKAALYIFLLTTFFSACQNNDHSAGHDAEDDHLMQENMDESHENMHPVTAEEGEDVSLQLNNGMKWEADKPTTENIHEMYAMTLKYESAGELEKYHQAGAEAEEIFKNIFSECTMKGAAHDELHKLLIQIKPEIETMKTAGDMATAEAAMQRLQQKLKWYDQYFEQV